MVQSAFVAGAFVVLSSLAFGQTIRLGELKGSGLLEHKQNTPGLSSNQYTNECNLAYNIYITDTQVRVDFGVVTCARGTDAWNDTPVALERVGNRLLLKNKEVGQVAADGTVQFTLPSSKTYKVTSYHTDEKCSYRNGRIETKYVKLEKSLSYTLKAQANGDLEFSRVSAEDILVDTYVKEYPNCPSGRRYLKGHVDRTISSVLKK